MARALAGKDAATLRSLFTTPVEFLAVTPGRFWDADTAIGVVDDLLLGTWFGEGTDIVDLSGSRVIAWVTWRESVTGWPSS